MKRKALDLVVLSILLSILGYVYFNHMNISTYIVQNYIIKKEFANYKSNTYTKNEDYLLFQETDDFIPKNKKELINILYTILDKGWEKFSFYCDESYTACNQDLKDISNDEILNTMNNYVHPFNSYKTLNIAINNFNIINVEVLKNYSDDEIKIINKKINDIIDKRITKNMSTREKIKVFHDYIVEHTIYDKEEAKQIENNNSKNLSSYKAYNVLVNGIGLCGGYTDTLAIFLDKIGVNNFKISTDKHIWNVLYIDNGWYHIDMTWDDPVTIDGSNDTIYDYFIVTTDKLKEVDAYKHNYNENYYLEIK